MGIASWLGAGLAAFVLSRLIPTHRRSWWSEGLTAIASSLLAGPAASALDFGGWRVVDWRSAVFAFLVSFTAIGLRRSRGGKAHEGGRSSA